LESTEAIAALLAARLSWGKQRQADEIAEYKSWLSHLAVPGRENERA
jgi:hypothetical protein